MNRRLGGAVSLKLLLTAPDVDRGLRDPDVLQRVDALRTRVMALEKGWIRAASASLIADILKETHQALNENRSEYYRVPDDAELVAQELLLFESSGSDEVEDFVDGQFEIARLTIRIPWRDAIETAPYVDAVEALALETLGDQVRVVPTGGTVIYARVFSAVIESMAQSYGLALLIVAPLMMLLIGSVRGGLMSMIPNLTPVVVTLGLMGWLGYRLDFATMMVGAIVLGVAVDDTIHFMHGFQRSYAESGNPREAIRATMDTTGRAILITSIVLCVGFSGFMLATMRNLVTTGVLTSFAICVAFFADVLLVPAMVTLLMSTRRVAGLARRLDQADSDTATEVAGG